MDILFTFKIALKTNGFSVVTSKEPLKAIEHYKSNPDGYFLIITDSKMPKMSGTEFACKVREINKKIKIWLLSSADSQYVKDPLIVSANFERIISKPVPIDKLVDWVKSTATC